MAGLVGRDPNCCKRTGAVDVLRKPQDLCPRIVMVSEMPPTGSITTSLAPAESRMCRAAAAPDRGAGSREAAENADCTRHWAHIANSMAGAIQMKYIGSKNIAGKSPFFRAGRSDRKPVKYSIRSGPPDEQPTRARCST